MKMTTRQATAEDAHTMSVIHAESWKSCYRGMVAQPYLDELQDDFWLATFHTWLSTGAAKAVLLYVDGTPAACSVYGASRDQALPDWAEIITVYARPQFWGLGCGKMLLCEVLRDLRTQRYANAYLWVLQQNKNAAGFYRHMGFAPTGETLASEILGKPLTDYRYAITLAAEPEGGPHEPC